MRLLAIGLVTLLLPAVAAAQGASPLYRVFLTDGSSLSSYGEWARVDDRIVFSMPIVAEAESEQLHLVSLPGARVDWRRTEDYANAVRAAHYASHRGEEDFARLASDVTRVINEISLMKDPAERLMSAERARRALSEWPAAHHGYRAKEVNDMIGTLDEVIGYLRAAAGLGRFDLTLTANTTTASVPELLPSADQADLVQQLITASSLVETPAEKVSLLQTVVGVIDRAVGMLPEMWAASLRTTALGAIAEEQRTDAAYARLRDATLASASRYSARADVRSLERLRSTLQEQDMRLGQRRAADVAAITAAIQAHIHSAQQLRLAHDQWLVRSERVRAYQRTTFNSVAALERARAALDDIKALAGPPPARLHLLIGALTRERQALSLVDPPAELESIHALLRSAGELAMNAATLRRDAIEAADLEVARRASSAAAGAIMLLAKARSELEAALRPPIQAAAAQ